MAIGPKHTPDHASDDCVVVMRLEPHAVVETHGFPLHIGHARVSRSQPSAAAIFSTYVVAFWIHVGNVSTTRIADVQRPQRRESSLDLTAAPLL